MSRRGLLFACLCSNVAVAGTVGVQLESGAVVMAPPSDDTYVERAMGSHESYNTIAIGAALTYRTHGVQLSLGYRNLGDQHSSGPIIGDTEYFACRSTGCVGHKAEQYWQSEGNEQQLYAEVGYAFALAGDLRIVPSVGIAETRISWHSDVVWHAPGANYSAPMQAKPQTIPAPFVGLTFQHSRVGVGFFYLVTDPIRSMAVDSNYPGQGKSAVYVRVTYQIGGNSSHE